MSVKQTVRLDEGHRRQIFAVDGGEEIVRILYMRSALCGISHDRGGVRFKIADIAIRRADLHSWVGAGWIMLQSNGGGIGSAVVSPGDIFLVESFADSFHVCRWNRAALGNTRSVNRAIRQKPRTVIVHHVVVIRLAVRTWVVGER